MLHLAKKGGDTPVSHTHTHTHTESYTLAREKLQWEYSITSITQEMCSQSKLEMGGKNFPVTFLHIASHHNSKENFV